jgi:signal peptidase II
MLLLSGACVLLADQLTKALAARLLVHGRPLRLSSHVHLCYARNTFGHGGTPRSRRALVVLWGAAFVTLVLITWDGPLFHHPVARAALGAALGGAASNLYDRLRRGAVIDLVKVGWWPVFNLADVGITAGAIAAIWFIRW